VLLCVSSVTVISKSRAKNRERPDVRPMVSGVFRAADFSMQLMIGCERGFHSTADAIG
jgi:hypothetical protein